MSIRTRESRLLTKITTHPERFNGRPCVRDERVRVTDILELLASGMTPKQITKQLPFIDADDIAACLLYAARYMDHPRLVA